MRPGQNPAVIAWITGMSPEHLRMTVVSLHEMQYGIEQLPAGKKRRDLAAGLGVLIGSGWGASMLVLDATSAERAAIARAAALRATGYCDVPDALIAGIAIARAASVATRNIKDFRHFGVPLIDPWA